MASTSAIQVQDDKFKSLGLSKMVVNKEQVSCYSRGLGTASEKNPVLVLIHGYPQSAYMWRHLIPLLPSEAPIFTPDLPGYGASAPIENNDKLTVGNAIMAALKTEIKRTSSGTPPSNTPVVLIGHDRGARVAHRLAVSGVEGFDVLGVSLIDIVPTSVQWAAGANAAEASGYFHWPFLANASLATSMITAFGPAKWCTEMTLRWAGKNAKCLEALKADNALDVYEGFFSQPHTVESSCLDYKAGATVDIEAQEQDQKSGKKISSPLLLLYSNNYIGTRYTFPDVWRDWTKEGVDIQYHGFGNGIGHFGAEEAPEESAKVLGEWLKGLLETSGFRL